MSAARDAFAGKHALLTGGSGGIGVAIARALLERSCGVTLIARREAALAAAAGRLREVAPRLAVRTLALDVADEQRVGATIPQELAEQPADLLINCAGIATPAEFVHADPTDLRAQMDSNYYGAVWMIRAVVPSLLERGGGHIVNMASTAALIGVYGYSGYCPSKFALYGLSEVLRAELRPRGIGVTVVLPGSTRTAMLEHELQIAPPETKKLITSTRVLTAEQVARATLRAVAARRFEVIPGLESRLSVRSYRLLPSVGRAFLDREIRRARA
jgi:3-dehydrosphinganine reductase